MLFWLAGACFTSAFIERDGFWFGIACIIIWPVMLGDEVRRLVRGEKE